MHYLETLTGFLHLFGASLAEVTTPSSRTFPVAAAALEAQIPLHSLLIPLLQHLGREKPLENSLKPSSSPEEEQFPKSGQKAAKVEPQLLVKRKIVKDLQELMAKLSLVSDGSRFQCAPLLSQPSRELPRQNSTQATGIICLWWFSFFKDKNKSKHLG